MVGQSKSLFYLQEEEKKLLAEESVILNLITQIKTQRMSLEVEQYQLVSMVNKLQNTLPTPLASVQKINPEETVALLDEAQSSINTRVLDLSVNDFNENKTEELDESEEEHFDIFF